MGLIAKDNGGGDFQLPPEGTHRAMCYMLVDLGFQQTGFGPKHKVHIGWELTDELMEDGRPFSVSSRYTNSLNEKANLRHHLESWRGKQFTEAELDGFNLANILGVPALVTVVHNTNAQTKKTYANVTGVTALPKSMEKPAPVNEPLLYDLDDPETNWDKVPEWLQKTIDGREKAPSSTVAPVGDTDYEDSIPF